MIEDPEIEQITIGHQKEINDVLKPHRILLRDNYSWRGTLNAYSVDEVMDAISEWKGTELHSVKDNLTDVEIDNLVSSNKRMTLHFPDEVPIAVFSSVLPFSQTELPNSTFNRMIIDFGKVLNGKMQIYFVSEKDRTLHVTDVSVAEMDVQSEMKKLSNKFVDYVEIPRANNISLFVPKEKVTLEEYTYIITDITPDEMKEALFIDPTIAKRTWENVNSIKYTDGTYLMVVDQVNKMINYVYPPSESIAPIPASQLLKDSFEFINEHGGLTGDYRFVSMNKFNHETEYQLFKHGYPVFSNTIRISTTWGEKEIYSYKRPYYIFDVDMPVGEIQLPSGEEIINLIKDSDLQLVDDIMLGYHISEDEKGLLFSKPSWFAIQGENWVRLVSETTGGKEDGLE